MIAALRWQSLCFWIYLYDEAALRRGVSEVQEPRKRVLHLGVFLVGAWLALSQGNITPGVVLMFVNLMNFVIQPIAKIPEILAGRKATLGLIDKLAQRLTDNVRDEGDVISPVLKQGISGKGLAFSYNNEDQVLKGMTCEFKAGMRYALVGVSGSGKTTLLNLLISPRHHGSSGLNIMQE